MYEFLWSILHPLWVTAFQKNTFVIFPGDGEPRSQGSLLPALRIARERDPGKRWSRVSQNLGDYKQTI